MPTLLISRGSFQRCQRIFANWSTWKFIKPLKGLLNDLSQGSNYRIQGHTARSFKNQKWLGEQEKIIYLSGSVARQSRLLKNKTGIYFSGSVARQFGLPSHRAAPTNKRYFKNWSCMTMNVHCLVIFTCVRTKIFARKSWARFNIFVHARPSIHCLYCI